MDLTANVVLNIFSVLILSVLFVYSSSDGYRNSKQRRLYLLQLTVTAALLIFDTMGRCDALNNPAFPVLNRVGNFFLFLCGPLLPSLWLEYVYLQIFGEKGIPVWVHRLLAALNGVNVLLVVATQFTGWYYAIDGMNIYYRGPLQPLSSLIMVVLLVWAYAVAYWNRRTLDRRVMFSLLFFPFPAFMGLILQAFVYGFPFALIGAMPSLLIVLLYAKDDSIYTDYLTGVGNRKKLEAVLKEKIDRSSRSRTFSFVMLDIDNFKKINDSLGHEAGDRMLKATADLLKRCVRSVDYVTRYGGDEFCLILDVSTEMGLQRVVDRIDGALNALNQSGALPSRLSFSMGRATYSFDERLPAEEFLKRADLLMYVDKRRKNMQGRTPMSDAGLPA
jgi:diguanylate cyclase (GGDEF)-like protein